MARMYITSAAQSPTWACGALQGCSSIGLQSSLKLAGFPRLPDHLLELLQGCKAPRRLPGLLCQIGCGKGGEEGHHPLSQMHRSDVGQGRCLQMQGLRGG